MKPPFVWGKGGRAMTPEDVERERELVALARAKMGDTSPVGHWTQGATRVVDALGAVMREKRTNKAEAAGLAGADEHIAAILAGQGGGGQNVTYSASNAPAVVPPTSVDPAEALGNDAMAALGKVDPTLELIKGFEGFRETPYWDVNALRTGYGSDTITTADGRVIPVTEGTRVSREDADRDLQRRAQTEFAPLAASAVGAETFAALDPNQKAALTSIAYNYGELPSSVAAAVRSGDPQAAAAAIAALSSHNGGINAGRRSKEAEVYLGASVPGGQPPTYAGAGGGSVAPGGYGGMDIASILALQSDPWVAKKYGGVVDALMGQQFSRQNALWEQEQRMADPMYQAQLEMAQLELQQAQAPQVADPFASTKEIGGVLYGPDGQGGFTPLITPPSAEGPRPLTDPAERARWGIPPTDTRPYAIEAGKPPQVVGGGGVTVNNDLGGADKFDEAFAKGDAATVETVNNAGLAAQRNLGRIDQLESILSSTPTGMGASLAQAAGEWGIPTEGLSEIQAAQALINSLVPEQRQPGSGPMSDADLALFKQSLPRIINQPGGNQVIIDTMRAIAQYDAEGAAIVQRMRLPSDDPNHLDRGEAFSALQNRPNPLESIKAAGGGGDTPTGNQTSSGVQWSIEP